MTPRKLIEPARLAGAALLRGQTDERLIDLTRAGNEKAFEAIVHRYRGPLLRYCARILPPGSAEDAVQQAFLNAYSAISSGDTDLKLRPWLYRIAHNSALNLLRQNGWNHEQLDEQFDGVLRPDQAVETRERIRSLVASVQELPERQRDAIVLRELEGRSYEEIAAALGVTDGAVRQLLNRARTALRAGATAVTPYGLAERIAMAASGGGGAVSDRVAEICGAGAGGALTLAKIGTAVLVAGAVATSAANHDIPVVDAGHDTPSARGATPDGSLSGPNGSSDSRAGGGEGTGRDRGNTRTAARTMSSSSTATRRAASTLERPAATAAAVEAPDRARRAARTAAPWTEAAPGPAEPAARAGTARVEARVPDPLAPVRPARAPRARATAAAPRPRPRPDRATE